MKSYQSFLILILLGSCLAFLTPVYADDDSEDASKDDARVYHFFDEVSVVSTLKLRYGTNPKLFAKLVYPQLENAGDDDNNSDDGITDFNLLTKGFIEDAMDQFKQELSNRNSKGSLYIDYDTSGITGDDDHVVSIRFSIQSIIAGMAHPIHYHHVLNYDLDYSEELTLDSLFLPNSNYLSVLADYCNRVLSRRLSVKNMIASGTAPIPENYRNWNIKPKGLLITFDEYQVAPYSFGPQTVLVPYSFLKPIIASDAIIASCAKRRNKCLRNNLQTGGFIDEA